jgi:allantoicase
MWRRVEKTNKEHGLMDIQVSQAPGRVAFTQLIDLASEAVGGKVLFANDDFFAEKENLLKRASPVFIATKYTDRGKWMDGWESRRKREVGHDLCIVKLGIPGILHGVNIDTSFFTGNFPEYASLEACESDSDDVKVLEAKEWVPVLPKSELQGHTQNYFFIAHSQRVTHLRLRIFPDGGVARLRVHGMANPSLSDLKGVIDVASAKMGAQVISANDSYFGPRDNLIFPGRAEHMGEGWETRRKRGPGHDWLILRLAGSANIQSIEVDTHHFKGNFPDACSIEGAMIGKKLLACDFRDQSHQWTEILPKHKLKADFAHKFSSELKSLNQKFDHIRLNIYPDGGVSRLRIMGVLNL